MYFGVTLKLGDLPFLNLVIRPHRLRINMKPRKALSKLMEKSHVNRMEVTQSNKVGKEGVFISVHPVLFKRETR